MARLIALLFYLATFYSSAASKDLRAQLFRHLPSIKDVPDACEIDCLQDYGPCDNRTGSRTQCHVCACTSCLDYPYIAPCCSLIGDIPYYNCLNNNLASASSAGVLHSSEASGILSLTATLASTTPAPTIASATDDCYDFNSIVSSCSSKLPYYDNLPFSSKAPCLCYISGSLQTQVYDSAFGQCLSALETASPAFIASIEATRSDHTISTNLCAHYYATTSAAYVNGISETTATFTSMQPGQSIIGRLSSTAPSAVTIQVTVNGPAASTSTSSALGAAVAQPHKKAHELLPLLGALLGWFVV